MQQHTQLQTAATVAGHITALFTIGLAAHERAQSSEPLKDQVTYK